VFKATPHRFGVSVRRDPLDGGIGDATSVRQQISGHLLSVSYAACEEGV
jgi:hypothetical protein